MTNCICAKPQTCFFPTSPTCRTVLCPLLPLLSEHLCFVLRIPPFLGISLFSSSACMPLFRHLLLPFLLTQSPPLSFSRTTHFCSLAPPRSAFLQRANKEKTGMNCTLVVLLLLQQQRWLYISPTPINLLASPPTPLSLTRLALSPWLISSCASSISPSFLPSRRCELECVKCLSRCRADVAALGCVLLPQGRQPLGVFCCVCVCV